VGTEFLRQAGGTIVTFEKNGVPFDGVAQGIVKKDETSNGDCVIDFVIAAALFLSARDAVFPEKQFRQATEHNSTRNQRDADVAPAARAQWQHALAVEKRDERHNEKERSGKIAMDAPATPRIEETGDADDCAGNRPHGRAQHAAACRRCRHHDGGNR